MSHGPAACFSQALAYRFAAMDKTVIEVQVRAVLPTSGGCAVFLGNNDKVFIIYVDQTVGSAITMFMREVSKERPLTHDLMGHFMTAARRARRTGHYQRSEKRDLLRAHYHSRGKRIAAEKNYRARCAAERLHRHGDATESADLREPGSLG